MLALNINSTGRERNMQKPYVPGIGNATPRVDAAKKVTGAEKYAADYYGHDLLWDGVKRAGIPHRLIREVKTAKAKNLRGCQM
jgi:CO/xanthine dehydrogenase Mo-binding subunit